VISKIKQQAIDLWVEVHDRVDWPSTQKVRSATLAVVTVSVFVGAFFWGVDWVLGRGVGLIFPHR
jgi:preprotein translocase SecE subunit